MRRSALFAFILTFSLLLASSPFVRAEESAEVKAGTKIKAELESTLDTRTAKPGDEVVARVTKDVKQDGKKVVRKGDLLKGRIGEVEADGAAESGSRLNVVFDRLVQGESTSRLNAVLTAVLSTPAEEQARREEMMTSPRPMPAPSPQPRRSAGSSSSSGGLVGGAVGTVGSTVGSTVGAAGETVGGVAGAAGTTLESTTHGAVRATTDAAVGTPAKAIQLGAGTNAESQSGVSSMLSTRQGHLRLESGSRLEFRVAADTEDQASTR